MFSTALHQVFCWSFDMKIQGLLKLCNNYYKICVIFVKKMMIPLIQNNIQLIQAILQKHNVKYAFIFGSACTDKFDDNSDVDMIIAFQKRYFDNYVDNYLSLESELSKLLNRNIDLVAEETIQNPYFIWSINQTKTPIYER